MDLKEIKGIIDLMTKHGLVEFELEKPEGKIRIKKTASGEFVPSVSSAPAPGLMPVMAVQPPAAGQVPASALTSAPTTNAAPPASEPVQQILSPMVGTFYRSPSPDAEPYVQPGQEVTPDTVVCIIEAMKVMNEIKAEMRGIITEVVAQNGHAVEFGKPLFSVKPL